HLTSPCSSLHTLSTHSNCRQTISCRHAQWFLGPTVVYVMPVIWQDHESVRSSKSYKSTCKNSTFLRQLKVFSTIHESKQDSNIPASFRTRIFVQYLMVIANGRTRGSIST